MYYAYARQVNLETNIARSIERYGFCITEEQVTKAGHMAPVTRPLAREAERPISITTSIVTIATASFTHGHVELIHYHPGRLYSNMRPKAEKLKATVHYMHEY